MSEYAFPETTRSIMDTHFSTLVTLNLIMLSLQNTSLLPTANSIYSHFEIACKEIAAETISLKHKKKKNTVGKSEYKKQIQNITRSNTVKR